MCMMYLICDTIINYYLLTYEFCSRALHLVKEKIGKTEKSAHYFPHLFSYASDILLDSDLGC